MSVRGVRLDSDEEEPEDDVEDKKPSKARRKNTADRHVNTDGKVAHGTPDTKSDISAEKKPNKKRKRNCIEKDTTCETPGETKVFNKLLNPKHEVDSDIDSVEDGEPISAIAKMSGQHKTGLKILTIIPEYKEDLHSVPRDILDDNSKPGGEQKKEGIDQRESNSMSIEEMMDSFSDDDDSSEEKQVYVFLKKCLTLCMCKINASPVFALERDFASLYTLWGELSQNQLINASVLSLPGETLKTD